VNRIKTLKFKKISMFEKFTEGAIKVIMLSQEEARRMGHNFVGTEQLLLVLLDKDMVLEQEH
jgi:ATP-dependent Clp protease ATP-binding subunit ClpA